MESSGRVNDPTDTASTLNVEDTRALSARSVTQRRNIGRRGWHHTRWRHRRKRHVLNMAIGEMKANRGRFNLGRNHLAQQQRNPLIPGVSAIRRIAGRHGQSHLKSEPHQMKVFNRRLCQNRLSIRLLTAIVADI